MIAVDFATALTVWSAAFRHTSPAQESVNSAFTLSAMMASTTALRPSASRSGSWTSASCSPWRKLSASKPGFFASTTTSK